MQCKDIPDRPVLQFLVDRPWSDIRNATWFATATEAHGDYGANSVLLAMPPNTPEKLALAKMRSLIRRGLVDGCPCGCRGDFEITAKGRSILSPHPATR
jgi:hypothetical protein